MTKAIAVMTAMNLMMKSNDNGEYTEVIEVLGKMVDGFEKTNSRPKKLTQRQIDNASVREYLTANFPADPVPASDLLPLAQNVQTADAMTLPRVVSLLTQMVKDNTLVKSEVKGKTYYSLATADAQTADAE